MQCYTILLITVNALHVSGGFSAHHQEFKNCTHSIWYVPGLVAATASSSSKQAWHIPDAVCTVLELLIMGGETAHNIDNNEEYSITLPSCWLYLKENINDARSHERQMCSDTHPPAAHACSLQQWHTVQSLCPHCVHCSPTRCHHSQADSSVSQPECLADFCWLLLKPYNHDMQCH